MAKGKKTVPVGESKKGDFPKNLNPWMKFLDAFRKKHPNMPLGKAMKEASKEYKKQKSKGKEDK